MALWPPSPRRGTWILLLLLRLLSARCHLHPAAPLSRGPEGPLGEAGEGPDGESPLRSWAETGLDAGGPEGAREELFPDMDPEALATVLLRALQIAPQDSEQPPLRPRPGASQERAQSGARSSEAQLDWQPGEGRGPPREGAPAGQASEQQEAERLESMLKELQEAGAPGKREGPAPGPPASPSESPRGPRPEDARTEPEEPPRPKLSVKREAAPREPWAGARKLRQQQHLEHQLLQRRYEELAESRRQAEEARRAAAEEERLADMASDLLLQYLLKDGDEEGEGQPGPNAREESGERGGKAGPLLFEDLEGNVAEDKRSNEAPEEEEEEEDNDIDPNTIDRLIELSSKLHLPADDVIDIINDVERKKPGEPPAPSGRGRGFVAPPRGKPRKAPPAPGARQEAQPAPKAFPPHRPLPKPEEAAWNEVLKGGEFPLPKRHQAKDRSGAQLSNRVSARTFQSPVYHHRRRLPGPRVPPRDGSHGARDEDLENYLGELLLTHPEAFQ